MPTDDQTEIHKLKEIIRRLLNVNVIRWADDCGPPGEGWQSDELSQLWHEAEEAVREEKE